MIKEHFNSTANRSVLGVSEVLRNRRGYTFVELLVTFAVIGILVGLGSTALRQSRATSRRVQCQNNQRNINLAMLQVADSTGRFPASGNYGRDAGGAGSQSHHSWVVDVLPWLEQGAIADQWNKDQPINSATNGPLAQKHIPILTCPADISISKRTDRQADLSYVVNGGIGFTVQWRDGTHDCPVDRTWTPLDLDGDGVTCPPEGSDPDGSGDKTRFLAMGLFFIETWGDWDVTKRFHRLADVTDGLSNTVVLSENVRTGYDPENPTENWASPNPYRTSFYIGNPCADGDCSEGNVDYARSNSGENAINSGLRTPEGRSPVPNSFHTGMVHMAFADGHVQPVAETIDGAVYAALASPQGGTLAGTPLEQPAAAGVP